MNALKAVWQSLARAFNLHDEPIQSRLGRNEVEAIGRRGIGLIIDFVGEEADETGWRVEKGKPFMGRVPDHVFQRQHHTSYDGFLDVVPRRERCRLTWEATTNRPGHRGGHLKVLIDDDTGRIVEGYAVPY